ncbi:hypothetical protein ABPG73_016949, partial [Tetrahymena malaccensis]
KFMARLAIQMLFFCFNQNDQSTAFRIYFIQRLWIQSATSAKYNRINSSLRYKKLLSQKLPNASTFILDLNLNTIRLQYLSALGSANFQNLTDLTIIGLSNIILDESLILKSMLSNCGHTLQNLLLDLEKSNIGNKSQLNLCQGLASCINMSTLVLNMSYVWISNEFFKQFSSTQFEQLESLTLDVFYRADSSQHSDICYALQACQKVSHLNLKLGNFFDDDESAEKKLYPALAKCQDVKSLNLKLLRRQINQSYFSVLGNILVSFTKLQILELELGNFKEGNLFVNLVQHLANCKSLFKLKLTLFYYNEDNNVILSEDPTNQGLVLTQCEKLYILELNISFPRLGYAPEKLYQMKLRQHLKKSKRLVNFLY